jgi:hypothetical protein
MSVDRGRPEVIVNARLSRSSRARAQSDERIEYQSIDVQALAKCTFARARAKTLL